MAVVLVVSVFGWTGGRLLVTESYADAKDKVAEQKAQRAARKEDKQAERAESGRGRFRRRRENEAGENSGSQEGGASDD